MKWAISFSFLLSLFCSAQQIDYNTQIKNKPSVFTTAPLTGGSGLIPSATISLIVCPANQLYQSNGVSWSCTDPSSIPASTHNILSSTHTDTTAAAAMRGDGFFAIGATPTWQRLAHPAMTGGYFKWNGTDIVASTGAAGGTGTCTNQVVTASNSDAAPTCTTITSAYTSGTFTATAHNLLSATHGDTASHSVVRGDIIAGIGVSPAWTAVAKGGTNAYPKWNSSGDVVASTGAAGGTGTCTNQFVRAENADAAPTCATVSLTADVSGVLPVANESCIGFCNLNSQSGGTVIANGASFVNLYTYTLPANTLTATTQSLQITCAGFHFSGTQNPEVEITLNGVVVTDGSIGATASQSMSASSRLLYTASTTASTSGTTTSAGLQGPYSILLTGLAWTSNQTINCDVKMLGLTDTFKGTIFAVDKITQ